MDLDPLVALLTSSAAADRFSGAVRIDEGQTTLLRQAFGLASRTWRVPCHVDTRFDVASVTKLFTAVAVLQQVEGGSFDLETRVVPYLNLRNTSISDEVTAYQLLTHTSGIADDADEEAGERYEDLFVTRPNYAIRQTADFLPQFAHKAPNFAPGQGCRYCNCGYILLGLMVERATGATYRDYVTEHVFRRGGMDRSGFFAMDVVTQDVAEGADGVKDGSGDILRWRRNIYSYPPVGSPDGGAHVTVDDLITFHHALRDGRLLTRSLADEMLAPHEDHKAGAELTHRTGYGLEFDVDQQGEVVVYWKEGMNVGASAMLAHYPSLDLTLSIASNMEDGVWEPVALFDGLVAEVTGVVAHQGWT
ncbi:MAG TPA: serine hydrolase domain-containing protein [Actinomycetes bacterium]|nr:serine hydrolase domain-containing protein [Actinomycetes bacterium]